MSNINNYLNLIRFYNPIGFWLLLWPGIWGLFISENLTIQNFVIVIIGAFLTRSIGCAVNDILDRNIDGSVKRTASRPLATGELKPFEAIIFTLILAVLALIMLSLTSNYAIKIVMFVAIPLIVLYPLSKRFFLLPQLILGLTFGLSLPISYAIANDSITIEILFLYMGCACWITAYDSFYALTDYNDDKKIEVNSLPITFKNDTYKVVNIFFILFIMSIVSYSYVNSSSIMILGILFLFFQMFHQNKLSKNGKHLAAFKSNSHVGAVLAIIFFIEHQSELYS